MQTVGPEDDDGKYGPYPKTWRHPIKLVGHEADQKPCSDIGQEESDKQGSASPHARADVNDNVNESELSAPAENKSFRADAARGN